MILIEFLLGRHLLRRRHLRHYRYRRHRHLLVLLMYL
jgi:hypothetical protein